MTNPQSQQIQIVRRDKPVFSDKVFVQFNTYSKKGKKIDLKSLSTITMRITFIDVAGGQTVADVTVPVSVGEEISNIISKQVKNFKEALKKGKITKQIPAMKTTSDDDRRYIG